MKVKNKWSIIVKLIYFLLVLYVIYLGYSQSQPSSYVEGISNHYNSNDFYKWENYNINQLNLSFFKYYYHEEEGQLKIKNMNYELIDNNAETVKSNIRIFLDKLHELNKPIDIEFDYDIITSNDYYSLKSNEERKLLHYYDIEENVLYIIDIPY